MSENHSQFKFKMELAEELVWAILEKLKPNGEADKENVVALLRCSLVCQTWRRIGLCESFWDEMEFKREEFWMKRSAVINNRPIMYFRTIYNLQNKSYGRIKTQKSKDRELSASFKLSNDKSKIITRAERNTHLIRLAQTSNKREWVIFDSNTGKKLFNWPDPQLQNESQIKTQKSNAESYFTARQKCFLYILLPSKMVIQADKVVVFSNTHSYGGAKPEHKIYPYRLYNKGIYYITLNPPQHKTGALSVNKQELITFKQMEQQFWADSKTNLIEQCFFGSL